MKFDEVQKIQQLLISPLNLVSPKNVTRGYLAGTYSMFVELTYTRIQTKKYSFVTILIEIQRQFAVFSLNLSYILMKVWFPSWKPLHGEINFQPVNKVIRS